MPALGFRALSKLALSGPTASTPASAAPVDPVPAAEPLELVNPASPTRSAAAVVPIPADTFTRVNGVPGLMAWVGQVTPVSASGRRTV